MKLRELEGGTGRAFCLLDFCLLGIWMGPLPVISLET